MNLHPNPQNPQFPHPQALPVATRLLASVANLREAKSLATLAHPPHIVDFKSGVFDGWQPAALKQALEMPHKSKVGKSAVVGAFEEPEEAAVALTRLSRVLEAVKAPESLNGGGDIKGNGLDYLKLAITNPTAHKIRRLGALIQKLRSPHPHSPQEEQPPFPKIVLVLFGEECLTPQLMVNPAKQSGFAVVMLDTLLKASKIADILSHKTIKEFVALAHQAEISCGLAGGLDTRLTQQYLNLAPKPHILGFRGALCLKNRQDLCLQKVAELVCLFASQASAKAGALRVAS